MGTKCRGHWAALYNTYMRVTHTEMRLETVWSFGVQDKETLLSTARKIVQQHENCPAHTQYTYAKQRANVHRPFSN